MTFNMGEIKIGSIVYLKKENLAAYLPSTYAKTYQDNNRKYLDMHDPLCTHAYPANAAKLIHLRFEGPNTIPDVKVKMLCDDQEWILPYNMIYGVKPMEYSAYDISLKYKDCTGFITKHFNADEVSAIPANNRYIPPKYKPAHIIYNDPATIVFWKDGTKTVVKRMPKEKFNPYNAFCAALAKKVFGNNSRVCKIVNNGEDQTKKKTETVKNKPKKK